MKDYKAYTLRNFTEHPLIEESLSPDEIRNIQVVGHVLPFKANKYVIEELIDWSDFENDPIYNLVFPNRDMLSDEHFELMQNAIVNGYSKAELKLVANKIRMELNPHPAGQVQENKKSLDGVELTGVQHKYRETMLFFPSQGQTCHAYCTFCFRWPQFVGMNELKFAMRDIELVIEYIRRNPRITDILITGGDPLIMRSKILAGYIDALVNANIPNLRTIRLGSKALSYHPQRFVTDDDADELLATIERARKSGMHIAFMAHFNHPNELKTKIARQAIERLLNAGATIRTQSPVMRTINDTPEAWAEMWQTQVELGLIPYYMFIARDTGAQDYFAVTLERAWRIFRQAYQRVSGLARSVRGPSMSAGPGKVHVLGVTEVMGEKVFALQFLQGRNPDWVARPFFARYDPRATWLDDLYPAFGEQAFFFENEYPIKRQMNGNASAADRVASSMELN